MADYSQLTLHGDSEVTRPEFQVEPGPDSTHTPFPGAATTPSGTRTFPRPGQDSEVERLQEQVRALQIRAGRAEQTLQDERRRRSRALEARQSTGSSEFGLTTYARPKLATPWTFKGSYSELLNVLNWINTVARYLDQCRADPEDWSGIARTYMHSTVQAWMDVAFPDTLAPPWDELVTELRDRYLPPDHSLRVEMKFEVTTQRRGLEEYVERFQTVDAALTLAGVTISDERKVTRFIRGLRETEDRLFVLQKRPANLKEVYRAVVTLRQAHVLSSSPAARSKPKERKLQQAQRQSEESPEEGSVYSESLPFPRDPKTASGQARCPGCGSRSHTLPYCHKAREAWNTAFSLFATQLNPPSAKSTAASKGTRHTRPQKAARQKDRPGDGDVTPSEGTELEETPEEGSAYSGSGTSHPEEQKEY